MAYVVRLEEADGTVTYAGKEGWKRTLDPDFLMETIGSARGKARHWKRISNLPGWPNDNFIRISIHYAQVNVYDEAEEDIDL